MSGARFADENLAGLDEAPARVGVLLPLALAGVYDYTNAKDLMLARGVYAPPSQLEAWFHSTAHSAPDVAKTIEAAKAAMRGV